MSSIRIFMFICLAASPFVLNGCSLDDGVSPRTVSIEPGSATIAVGSAVQLVATVISAQAETPPATDLRWTTSDPSIARVNETGEVFGVGDGTVVITAAYGGAEGTAAVDVWQPVDVRETSIEPVTHPLVRRFLVDLDGELPVEIDYWTATSPRLRVVSDEADSTHTVLVTRLRGNASYEYEVRSIGPEGLRGDPISGGFSTDPLPASFDGVTLTAEGEATALTLISLRSSFFGFVVVDSDGEVVWFYETEGTPQGSSRRANGNFLFVELGQGIKEVTPDGDLVAHLVDVGHHDVIPTPQNGVLFLTRDDRKTVQDTTWIGDSVWEWFPETDVLIRRWAMFDFYSILEDRAPRSRVSDWGHANSLSIGPRGNVVMSMAFLNQVISMTPDFATVEWRVGGPRATHVPPADALFSGQHTGAEVSPGRVLLFDNGFERTPDAEYSRALELELDDATGNAINVWEFRPPVDNYARIISAARRLANGNTLVHFGTARPIGDATTGGPIETFEVSPSGDVVWHLSIEDADSAYRATPIGPLAGEFVVVEP